MQFKSILKNKNRKPVSPQNLGITRDKILSAALKIVDDIGLEKFTIRKLALELSSKPMSVYRYFKNADDIKDCLLGFVIREYEVSSQNEENWKTWIHKTFYAMYEALLAHPGILPILGTEASTGTQALEVIEKVLKVLLKAGISETSAARGFYSLLSYTVGCVTLELGMRSHQPSGAETKPELLLLQSRTHFESRSQIRFPYIVELAPHLAEAFAIPQMKFGISQILETLEKEIPK
ncbi:TetR/AcrR family transcriptional regulator C-terminal domain-containing protein [Deltaproteobacteria bacterium TL4]